MDTLARLEATIAARAAAASGGSPAISAETNPETSPETSYVAQLLARGTPVIARKLGEEAVEAVVAALAQDDAALTGEAADLVFHLLVLLRARTIPFAAVLAELDRRDGVSGLAEKAARS